MSTTFSGEHWESSKTSVCVKQKTNKNAVRYYRICQFLFIDLIRESYRLPVFEIWNWNCVFFLFFPFSSRSAFRSRCTNSFGYIFSESQTACGRNVIYVWCAIHANLESRSGTSNRLLSGADGISLLRFSTLATITDRRHCFASTFITARRTDRTEWIGIYKKDSTTRSIGGTATGSQYTGTPSHVQFEWSIW